ncbi:nuclease-related domain-containing protein [Microtetraspora malaysiensis]|uniref:nuclease-related domain-containing protein n=1 Tax=Microtetraspora malaysiensis TaxID=161358 RepID=UPI003D94EC90
MVRYAPLGAGASAHARYRQEWAVGRARRLLVRVALALAAAVLLAVLVDWRAGLVAAALVALVDTVYRWRGHAAVRTWRRGALGERRTARRLRLLASLGYTVLHDRRLPHGRANVDHLVIGGTGVFVIDSKQWQGDRPARTGQGRRVQRGRVFTPDDAKAVQYEAEVVSRALSAVCGSRVEAVPVLAIHGPYVPRRGISVAGAHILRPSLLVTWVLRYRRVGADGLDPATVSRLQAAAAAAFPPYVQN